MKETTTAQTSGAAEPEARQPHAPSLGMSEQLALRKAQQKTNKVLWGIFGLLLVLVGVVIFVLPTYVRPPAPKVAAAPAATAAAPAPAADTPFEEAQRLRLRETAQNTLASLLALQATLEQKQVASWAGESFNAALAQARTGDEAYAIQQFAKANELYQAALTGLQQISDSQNPVFAAAMKEAAAAYGAGAAATAEAAYRKALLLQPDSAEAATGLKRSQVLPQVLKLMNEGRSNQAAQQLEAARESYQQAVALDGAYGAATAAVKEINAAIAERNFSGAMSRGFAAMQKGQYEQALAAFNQAQTLRPGAAEISAAIAQVNDRQSSASLNVHMEAATRLEAAESWQSAIDEWNQALAVDPNLVKAQQGLKRSQSRNQLDLFLNGTIASPLRLADEAVYKQTEQVLGEAGKLTNAGPGLQARIQKVRDYLARMRIAAKVQLQSDGLTKVTLYHVNELGTFTSQSVSLTPGAYTAVGVRNGYRDVRQEFVVNIDGQAPVVTVICHEAI